MGLGGGGGVGGGGVAGRDGERWSNEYMHGLEHIHNFLRYLDGVMLGGPMWLSQAYQTFIRDSTLRVSG